MQTCELTPGVYWVGAIDWSVRDFHGYNTSRGTTYNNYLVMDDEVTLIDTVKEDFFDISQKKIAEIVNPCDIKHIIVNHIEPDHGSGLDRMVQLAPSAVIYCTKKAEEALGRFFNIDGWNIKTVKSGDTLKTGKRTYTFLETPMLHWPDSMMTYLSGDNILFSQDGFGQHLASSQRFDDEFIMCSSYAVLEDSVWDYYANILMPFGRVLKKKLDEVRELGIQIDMIAPDHGIIWRKEPGHVLQMYQNMIDGKCDERVVIIYDTMWHSTEKLTEALLDGVKAEEMDCKVMKLRTTPISEALKEFWRARGTLLGSPTLNNNIFPPVASFLYALKGLRPTNRIISAFGSYGWAGGAVRDILQMCRDLKLEVPGEGFQVKYTASSEELERCFQFGRDFARQTKEYHNKF